MRHHQLILTLSGHVRFDDPQLDTCYPQKDGIPSLRSRFVKVEDLGLNTLLAALYQTAIERDRYRDQLERVKNVATVL